MGARTIRVWVGCLLVTVACSASADPVLLIRRDAEGDQARIVEEQRTETTISWRRQGVGGGAVNAEEVEVEHREYQESVVANEHTDNGLAWQRLYEVAYKSKTRPGDFDPISSGLLGRTVLTGLVGGQRVVHCLNGELSSDEQDDVKMDRLVYACLPTEPVERGDTWVIDPELLGRTFVGEAYDPISFHAEATGRLRTIRTFEGRRCAKVELAMRLGREMTSAAAGFDFTLEGVLYFALDEGKILLFELSGPVTYETVEGDGPGRATVSAVGVTRLQYIAELADPEEAGTGED